jgi:hypothetical protein
MALHSPSRFSSALRSAAPGRQATVVRSHRPSSRRFLRPYDAPSPRNPLPDGVSSPGATVRLSPLAGTGRLVTTRIVAIPPCLVAGFHPRFGPPPPFPTTLAACSSSNPVECFIHSRPWGSVPAPCCRPPVGRPEDRPSRCCPAELHRSSFRSDAGGEWSCRRLPVDSALDSCRSIHPCARPPLRPFQQRHRGGSTFPEGPAPAP